MVPHTSSPMLREWPFGSTDRPSPLTLDGRTVVLGFDHSPESAAAARVARAIAERHHATVRVVSVMDTSPVPIPFPLDMAIGMASEGAGAEIHREQAQGVRDRLAAVLSQPVDWPTIVALGLPADAIGRAAEHAGAALIVVGLPRHGLLDRAVHAETTLSIMHKVKLPVLGVTSGASGEPRRALVAMDFSRASVQAAVAAAQLMAPGGWLTLAYVESSMAHLGDAEGVIHSLGESEAFERLERALAADVLRVDHVVLHHTKPGAIATFLLEYAESTDVDLLVAGSARHGRLDRILLGSVSTELVRAGQCSTLVIPPSPNDR
jgi:nucleotide-binding universal stress UspA family protein